MTRSLFGFSNYNAMQFQVRRRARAGLTLLANFVWSKAIDNVSTSTANNSVIRNPFDLNADRGPSDTDVGKTLNVAAVYSLPSPRLSNGVLRGLIGGWQTNGILTARTGLPLTVVTGRDNSLSAVGLDHPDVVGSSARRAGADQRLEWFNVAAFVPNNPGSFGNAGRNIIRGPGIVSLDLSLFKNFALTEWLKLQARGEAFNAMNHANLGNPIVSLANRNIGQVQVAGNPRVLQIALKLMF